MKDVLTRFTKSLALISSLVALAGLSLFFLLPRYTSPALPWLILLFILSTYILFYILVKASEKKFNLFANYFMLASMLKIFLLILVISAYAYLFREDAIRFTVSLFVLYLIYTVFEVSWLLKISRMK